MKKLVLFTSLALSSIGLSAQGVDALNLFTTSGSYGSPRYIAMGGAFTALGNDMSALHINPASGAVYRRSNFNFSLGFHSNQQNTSFLGSNQQFNDFELNMDNIGGVIKFGTRDKFFIGFSYQKLADFDNSINANGANVYDYSNGAQTGLTLGEYWRDASSYTTADELASNGYLEEASALGIVVLQANNDSAFIDYPVDNQTQVYFNSKERGSRGEFAISLGGQEEQKFYYGISIGFTSLNYNKTSYISENGYGTRTDTIPYITESTVNFENGVDGSGLNFKAGFIYRPAQFVRIGASFESPTWWYRIDEFQTVSVDGLENTGTLYQGTEYVIDDISYAMTSPMIARAGLAFVLGKHAIVSGDYEFAQTNNINLSERDGYDYSPYQSDWESISQNSHALKGGLELRFGPMYLRGGYQYRTSAFDNLYQLESQRRTASVGAGFKKGSWGFDIAYSLSTYSTETLVHDFLSYAYVDDGSGGSVATEYHDVDRSIMTTDVKRGNFIVGMNFSF